MPHKKNIKCRTCGNNLPTTRNGVSVGHKRVFCSISCTQNRGIVNCVSDKKCARCGQTFIFAGKRPPKNFRTRKFCSKTCAAFFNKAHADEERAKIFWSKITTNQDAAKCWLWRGQTKGGYGTMRWRGKMIGAHRIAHMLCNGPIGEEMHILHDCDTPLCCNPNHLRQGSHQENMADAVARKRHPVKLRDSNPATKIKLKNWQQLVRECGMAARDKFGRLDRGARQEFAIKFGVSLHIVKRAVAAANVDRKINAQMDCEARDEE